MKNEHVLQGCAPTPLASYLKALDVLRKANAIAWAYNLTWYDAVYVALAEVLGYPLVTADEALMRKMRGHSVVLRLKDLAFE